MVNDMSVYMYYIYIHIYIYMVVARNMCLGSYQGACWGTCSDRYIAVES